MSRTVAQSFALFKRLVASDYAPERLTRALYHDLTLSFGFIAHFDRSGFYAARLRGWPERAETFEQVLGWSARTPFEQAVQAYVRSERLLDRAQAAAAGELEASERTELARLKAKYEARRPYAPPALTPLAPDDPRVRATLDEGGTR